jgi:hypothetical protein
MKAPRLSHVWDRHPDDYYIEPEWTSARLFKVHPFSVDIIDPACGSGRIVNAARQAGYRVGGFDIVKRAKHDFPFVQCDFIERNLFDYMDNIVSNPPFKHCDTNSDFIFVRRALQAVRDQVALLLPAKFEYGEKRGRFLQLSPLLAIYNLTPRPSMPPGPVIEAGEKPGNGREDFAWFVWKHGFTGEPVKRWLSRDDD